LDLSRIRRENRMAINPVDGSMDKMSKKELREEQKMMPNKSVRESEQEYKARLIKCSKVQLIEAVMRYRKIARDNGASYYKIAEKIEKIKEALK
jgi:hypothetical protein